MQCESTEILRGPCTQEIILLVYRDTIIHEMICRLQNSLKSALHSEWPRLWKQKAWGKVTQNSLSEIHSIIQIATFSHDVNTFWLFKKKLWWINDFLYKMPDKGQEMSFYSISFSFWPWFTHIYKIYPWQIFRFEKQKETSTWGLCFSSLRSRIWKKEVRICAKGTAKNNIFVRIWDTAIFKKSWPKIADHLIVW